MHLLLLRSVYESTVSIVIVLCYNKVFFDGDNKTPYSCIYLSIYRSILYGEREIFGCICYLYILFNSPFLFNFGRCRYT